MTELRKTLKVRYSGSKVESWSEKKELKDKDGDLKWRLECEASTEKGSVWTDC